MLSDILWTIVFLFFIGAGLTRPYIALCLVIWIDILKPQDLSFSFLAGKPLSLIATAVFFLSLMLNLNKIVLPARLSSTVLIALFMGWLTITTYYAEFQDAAWFKYDFVIKTLFLSLFIPFVLDTRRKLETLLGILVASVGYYTMIGGMRTFMGDSRYGSELVQSLAGDSGIAETSTLSMVSVFTLSFIFYIYKYSYFSDTIKFIKPLLIGLSFSCLLTTIGTEARTGLVGLLMLFIIVTYFSKQKLKIISWAIVVFLVALPFMSDEYIDRMNTLKSANQESSALGRIVVWKWTIDYVSNRPFMGGGFSSYKANAGELHHYVDSDINIDLKDNSGKAFHNIFFEVLGESGYVGLSMFFLLIFITWRLNIKIIKDKTEELWKKMFAKTINVALVIYCVCGMFIGVAYAPWLYYFAGLTVSLYNVKLKEELPGAKIIAQ